MTERGAISPAEVDRWIDTAAEGDSTVYAWGNDFPRSAPGVVRAKIAHSKGLVTFNNVRRNGRMEYVMRRAAVRAQRRARPNLSAAEAHDGEGAGPEAIIYLALRRAAANERPCPSNAALAERAGLPDPQAASYVIGKLKRAKRIAVEFVGPKPRRRIIILSSGACTGAALA